MPSVMRCQNLWVRLMMSSIRVAHLSLDGGRGSSRWASSRETWRDYTRDRGRRMQLRAELFLEKEDAGRPALKPPAGPNARQVRRRPRAVLPGQQFVAGGGREETTGAERAAAGAEALDGFGSGGFGYHRGPVRLRAGPPPGSGHGWRRCRSRRRGGWLRRPRGRARRRHRRAGARPG